MFPYTYSVFIVDRVSLSVTALLRRVRFKRRSSYLPCTIVDMTTALCVESKRRYPLATIYVPVYFPYSCSVHPLWRSGALPSRENEEASGPETLREGRVGRYLPSYCKKQSL